MRLHRPVLFVGDKPSKNNVDPDIPFVGTRSYKTLLSWIADMNVDTYVVHIMNSTDAMLPLFAADYAVAGRVVALGKDAHAVLDQLQVPHFTMPHPSGLNRQLNDKKELKNILLQAQSYIYDLNSIDKEDKSVVVSNETPETAQTKE